MRTTALVLGACLLPALLSGSDLAVRRRRRRSARWSTSSPAISPSRRSGSRRSGTSRRGPKASTPSPDEVEARAKAAGLQDVRWIEQKAVNPNWTGRHSEAWLIAGSGADAVETKIASMEDVATSLADNSRPANLTAELVDVGAGENAAGLRRQGRPRQDRSRLRIAGPRDGTGRLEARGFRASFRGRPRGSTRSPRRADQVAWLSVPEKDGPNGEKTTFAIVLSAREGKSLSDRMRGESPRRWGAGSTKAGEPLRLRVMIDSVVLPERRTAMVEARIPGTDPALPEIVLTAPSPGGKVFGQRRPVRGRQRPRDRPRPDEAHRQRSAAPAATRHTLLVGGRDLLRVPVLRRQPRRGEEVPGRHQPGHGGSEAVDRPSDAIHGSHALVAAVVPLRRPAEHSRRRRGRQQRVSSGVAGPVARSRPGVHETDLRAPGDAGALPGAGGAVLRFHRPPRLQRSLGARARDLADELARRVHPLVRRRPLANRSDPTEAQCLRRRGDGLVARQRGRRRRPLASFVAAGRRAPRRRSRPRRPGSRAARGRRRPAPRRSRPPRRLPRDGPGGARVRAADRGPGRPGGAHGAGRDAARHRRRVRGATRSTARRQPIRR